MAVEKTFRVSADTGDADDKLKGLEKEMRKVGKTARKTRKDVKEVGDNVKDNTKNVKKNTEEVQANTEAQTKGLAALKKLTAGMTGFGLAVKATGVKLLVDAIDFLKESIMNTQPAMDLMEKISIGISIAFQKVFDAVSSSNVSFEATGKVLGSLIKGTLNVLVITIEGLKLGILVAQRAWENSFFGNKDPDKLKRLNAEIAETKDRIKETQGELRSNIKNVATNFVDAVGEIANGVTEIAGNAVEAIASIDLEEVTNQAERVLALRKEAEKAALRTTQIQTEYQALIEAAQSAQGKENLSLAEKERLIKESARLRQELIEKTKEQVQIEAESLRQQAEISGLDEDKLAYQEKLAEIKQLEADIDSDILATNEELRDLETERLEAGFAATERNIALAEIEADQALAAEQSEQKKFEIQKENLENLTNLRLAALDEQMAQLDTESELYKQLADERLMLEKEYQSEVQALEQETADFRRDLDQELQDAKFDIALSGFDALGALSEAFAGEDAARAKKAFNIQKRLSQGQALVATYQAIIGALKAEGADGLLPFPVRVANAAIAGATGLAQVASIQRTSFESPEADVDIPTAASRTPEFNIVGTGGLNQLAQSVSQERPVRAYVVGSDVTTQQELDRNRINTASFG